MRTLQIIFIFLCTTLLMPGIKAQHQTNSLYYIENSPLRHNFNAAFQPLSDFYISLPFCGNTSLEMGNNTFSASSLLGSKLELIDKMSSITLLNAQMHMSLINFGFRHKSAFWNFEVATKLNTTMGIPRDMFKLILFGNANIVNGQPQYTNNNFDLKNFSLNANLITEYSVGYSKNISSKWTIGAKFKFLYGTANLMAYFNDFYLSTGVDSWKITGSGLVNIATPMHLNINTDLNSFSFSKPNSFTDYIAPIGVGSSLDLGINYKPSDNIQLSLAVNNLGYMKWNKNANNIALNFDYKLDDSQHFTSNSYNNIITKALIDTILSKFNQSANISSSSRHFSLRTSPTINASLEYGILNSPFTLGLLSTTNIINSKLYQDITTSCNYKPKDWINMSISYSILNGKGSNIGFGFGIRAGIANIFMTTDYIPITYTNIPTSIFYSAQEKQNLSSYESTRYIRIPYNTNRLNFAFGVNFVFSRTKDEIKSNEKTATENLNL